MKIIRGDELVENDYGATRVTDVFGGEVFDVAKIVKIDDDVKRGYNSESDIAYYVLEGEGICVLKSEEFSVKKGDLIFLPKGTEYFFRKGVILLAISNPPFDRKKRLYIEE